MPFILFQAMKFAALILVGSVSYDLDGGAFGRVWLLAVACFFLGLMSGDVSSLSWKEIGSDAEE